MKLGPRQWGLLTISMALLCSALARQGHGSEPLFWLAAIAGLGAAVRTILARRQQTSTPGDKDRRPICAPVAGQRALAVAMAFFALGISMTGRGHGSSIAFIVLAIVFLASSFRKRRDPESQD